MSIASACLTAPSIAKAAAKPCGTSGKRGSCGVWFAEGEAGGGGGGGGERGRKRRGGGCCCWGVRAVKGEVVDVFAGSVAPLLSKCQRAGGEGMEIATATPVRCSKLLPIASGLNELTRTVSPRRPSTGGPYEVACSSQYLVRLLRVSCATSSGSRGMQETCFCTI